MLFASVGPALAAPAAASDPRFYSQTGFRIDNDQFWDYFQHRGGVDNFGYPVSRTFMFLGATVQFFQRRIVEINPDGSVGQLNLLDGGLLPYTSFNYATFPASDPNLVKTAPAPGSPGYATAIIAWIRQHAPDNINGIAVKYATTFFNTVSMATAFSNGGGNQGLLQGIDLEMWGAPTSAPAADPKNSNFIYLRFQRGIMHYDNTTHTTQAINLADYLKAILTGQNLPGDLATEAAGSPYLRLYNNSQPNGMARPGAVGGTNLSNAFEAQQPIGGTPSGPPPSGTSGFHYGFQAQYYGQNSQILLNAIKGAGFNWTKEQVRWTDVQPNPGQFNWGNLDGTVNAANAAGVKVLFSVLAAPPWASNPGSTYPRNPQDFANFMSGMASHFKGKVAAYEVWNEENFAREVGPGNINAGNYVELLKVVYPAIKAADPAAIVLSGAPTPTGVNDPNIAERDLTYLQQMYQYQGGVVKNYFDVLGAHNEPYANPPDQTVATHTLPSYANDSSFFFRQVEDYRNLMVSMGDGNKQIWETEIGYDANDQAPADYRGWTVSEQQQASYLSQLFQYARAHYPWMGAIFVWNLNFQSVNPQGDEKWGFGVLRADYTPRPAYSALQSMPKP
jgi:polysaccharide biosynthesis protein PslG